MGRAEYSGGGGGWTLYPKVMANDAEEEAEKDEGSNLSHGDPLTGDVLRSEVNVRTEYGHGDVTLRIHGSDTDVAQDAQGDNISNENHLSST